MERGRFPHRQPFGVNGETSWQLMTETPEAHDVAVARDQWDAPDADRHALLLAALYYQPAVAPRLVSWESLSSTHERLYQFRVRIIDSIE